MGLLQLHIVQHFKIFRHISVQLHRHSVSYTRTTQLIFRSDLIAQMPRETREDQNKVWYKYISEDMIHLLFTVATLAFEPELIGARIVALGLESVYSAVVATQKHDTTHQPCTNGNAARSAH